MKLRRAIVVLMSAQGQPALDIAHLLKSIEDYIRDVIHALKERTTAPTPSRKPHSATTSVGATKAPTQVRIAASSKIRHPDYPIKAA